MTRYQILKAGDAGRTTAYDHITRLKSWPLAPLPPNPFLKSTAEEFTAWQQAFDETVQK
jgi:hypothetical protein